MRHFCTLFNSAYKFHSRLLYESICEHEDIDSLQFYFFCFDDDSLAYYKSVNLKNVELVSVEELENYFPELKSVKSGRNLVEYFFTSTPAICKYVFDNYDHVNEIVYLDADLFFFQSLETIFDEIGCASISIIPHRFSLINYYKNIYGYYNVGWVSFKKDKEGQACMNKWYQDNLEWCFDKLTFKKYADQKYLDYWEKKFKGVRIIKNKGANVAPWNVGNYKISLKNKSLYIDDTPLVFYHFASMKFIDKSYYTTISSYFSFVKPEIKNLIYRPYIVRLRMLGYTPGNNARRNKNYIARILRKLIRNFYSDNIAIEN